MGMMGECSVQPIIHEQRQIHLCNEQRNDPKEMFWEDVWIYSDYSNVVQLTTICLYFIVMYSFSLLNLDNSSKLPKPQSSKKYDSFRSL